MIARQSVVSLWITSNKTAPPAVYFYHRIKVSGLQTFPVIYCGLNTPVDIWYHPLHDNDVIMGMMVSQITSLTIDYSQIKENIKTPRQWPLCEEFTDDRWIPRTKGTLRGKCFHLMTSSYWWSMRNEEAVRLIDWLQDTSQFRMICLLW